MSYAHLRSIPSRRRLTARLSFAPRDSVLVIRPPTDETILFDVVEGDVIRVLRMPGGYPVSRRVFSECACFTPDGQQLLTVDGEWGIVWETSGWTATHRIQLSNKGFGTQSLGFSHDGSLLAAAGYDTGVSLWDTTHWVRILAVEAWEYVWSTAMAPDRRVIAVGYHDHDLRLFSLPYMTLMNQVDGYRQVRSLAFAPNGSLLAAACGNGFVRLLDVLTGTTRLLLDADPEHAEKSAGAVAALFTRDGKRLVTAGGRIIRIWDLLTGQLAQQLDMHEKGIRSLAISPDDRFLASCGYDRAIHVWERDSE